MTKEKKGILNGAKVLMVLSLVFTAVFLIQGKPAYAAPSAIRINSVEYYNEQIIIDNNDNTKICFATESEAAKNKWETIEADPGTTTAIDISWLSATTDNILVFKGADDPNQTASRVTIKEKPEKLTLTISYENLSSYASTANIAPLVNIMATVGDGNAPITFTDLEWKKGDNGTWKPAETLTVGLLKKYLIMGTYVSFRIEAVNDVATAPASADGTKGRRFSSEVKVKVVKQASPVVTGVDGSKFLVDIKYGKEYRVTYGTATTPTAWVRVTDRTIYKMPLATIIGNVADGSVSTKGFEAMKIEIRDYATAKTPYSKITSISLTKQRVIANAIVKGLPATVATTDSNIYYDYVGDTYINLLIPQASASNPYEYCVVKSGGVYDPTKVMWTSVTKGTILKIPATKAVDGSTLYVRMKEIKSKAATSTTSAVAYQLASTYQSFTLNYPSVPYIASTKLEFTKGYGTDLPITIVLNAKGKVPFETEVTSVKLGTKTIDFVTPPTISTVDGVQTMTLTLKADSLATLTNCYSKALTITFKNKTVNKTSVKLTVQSPTPAGDLVITPAKGTTSGTKFIVVTAKASGNLWAYTITDTQVKDVYTMDTVDKVAKIAGTAFTDATMDNIAVGVDKYLTIYELTVGSTNNYVVKYKSIKITSDYIK